jgi:NAD(P)-dependent dehydrogenase (short-subunit alcohol dehydrogenase family)
MSWQKYSPRFASRSFHQVYISSRSAKDCDVTAAELTALGPGKCIPIPADLQKLEEVTKLVKALSSKEKALHVLINNAGATWLAGVDETPVSRISYVISWPITNTYARTQDASFTKVLTINLQRVFTLTQSLLPLLRAGAAEGGMEGPSHADPARIINVTRVSHGLSEAVLTL